MRLRIIASARCKLHIGNRRKHIQRPDEKSVANLCVKFAIAQMRPTRIVSTVENRNFQKVKQTRVEIVLTKFCLMTYILARRTAQIDAMVCPIVVWKHTYVSPQPSCGTIGQLSPLDPPCWNRHVPFGDPPNFMNNSKLLVNFSGMEARTLGWGTLLLQPHQWLGSNWRQLSLTWEENDNTLGHKPTDQSRIPCDDILTLIHNSVLQMIRNPYQILKLFSSPNQKLIFIWEPPSTGTENLSHLVAQNENNVAGWFRLVRRFAPCAFSRRKHTVNSIEFTPRKHVVSDKIDLMSTHFKWQFRGPPRREKIANQHTCGCRISFSREHQSIVLSFQFQNRPLLFVQLWSSKNWTIVIWHRTHPRIFSHALHSMVFLVMMVREISSKTFNKKNRFFSSLCVWCSTPTRKHLNLFALLWSTILLLLMILKTICLMLNSMQTKSWEIPDLTSFRNMAFMWIAWFCSGWWTILACRQQILA